MAILIAGIQVYTETRSPAREPAAEAPAANERQIKNAAAGRVANMKGTFEHLNEGQV
jgi:hypothetical protein